MNSPAARYFSELREDLFARPQFSKPDFRSHWFRYVLYAIILAGCVIRVLTVFEHTPSEHVFSDTERHWKNGIEVLTQAPMPLYDPVGYQVWISAVGKLTQGDQSLTAIYASILSLITPWLWYRFQREFFASKQLALFGWAVLLWLPSWVGIFSYYMTETLLLPMLGISLWMSWRSMRKQTVGGFALVALLWTLTGLVRGIASY